MKTFWFKTTFLLFLSSYTLWPMAIYGQGENIPRDLPPPPAFRRATVLMGEAKAREIKGEAKAGFIKENSCEKVGPALLQNMNKLLKNRLLLSGEEQEETREILCKIYLKIAPPVSLLEIIEVWDGQQTNVVELLRFNLMKKDGSKLTLEEFKEILQSNRIFYFLLLKYSYEDYKIIIQYINKFATKKELPGADLRNFFIFLSRIDFPRLLTAHMEDPFDYLEELSKVSSFMRPYFSAPYFTNGTRLLDNPDLAFSAIERWFHLAPLLKEKKLQSYAIFFIDPRRKLDEALRAIKILPEENLLESCTSSDDVMQLCWQLLEKKELTPATAIFLSTFYRRNLSLIDDEWPLPFPPSRMYQLSAPLLAEFELEETDLAKNIRFYKSFFTHNQNAPDIIAMLPGELNLLNFKRAILKIILPQFAVTDWSAEQLEEIPLAILQSFYSHKPLSHLKLSPSLLAKNQEQVLKVLQRNLQSFYPYILQYSDSDQMAIAEFVDQERAESEKKEKLRESEHLRLLPVGCMGNLPNLMFIFNDNPLPVSSLRKICSLHHPENYDRSIFLTTILQSFNEGLLERPTLRAEVRKYFAEDFDLHLPFLQDLLAQTHIFMGRDSSLNIDPWEFLQRMEKLQQKFPRLPISDAFTFLEWGKDHDLWKRSKGQSIKNLPKKLLRLIKKSPLGAKHSIDTLQLYSWGVSFLQAHPQTLSTLQKKTTTYMANPYHLLAGVPRILAEVSPKYLTRDLSLGKRAKWQIQYQDITAPATAEMLSAEVIKKESQYMECLKNLWEDSARENMNSDLLWSTYRSLLEEPEHTGQVAKRRSYLRNCLFAAIPELLTKQLPNFHTDFLQDYFNPTHVEQLHEMAATKLTAAQLPKWQEDLQEFLQEGSKKWDVWGNLEKLSKPKDLFLFEVPPIMSIFKGVFTSDCSLLSTSYYGLLKDVKTFWINLGIDHNMMGALNVVPVQVEDPTTGESKSCPLLLSLDFEHGESRPRLEAVVQAVGKIYGVDYVCLPYNSQGQENFFFKMPDMKYLYARASSPQTVQMPAGFSQPMVDAQKKLHEGDFQNYYDPSNLYKVQILNLPGKVLTPHFPFSPDPSVVRVQKVAPQTPVALYHAGEDILHLSPKDWEIFRTFLLRGQEGTKRTNPAICRYNSQEKKAIEIYTRQIQLIKKVDTVYSQDHAPTAEQEKELFTHMAEIIDESRIKSTHTRTSELMTPPQGLGIFSRSFTQLLQKLVQKHGKEKLQPLLTQTAHLLEINVQKIWNKNIAASIRDTIFEQSQQKEFIQNMESIFQFLSPRELYFWAEEWQEQVARARAQDKEIPLYMQVFEQRWKGLLQKGESFKCPLGIPRVVSPYADSGKLPDSFMLSMPVRNQGPTLMCAVESTLANVDHLLSAPAAQEGRWFRASSLMAILDLVVAKQEKKGEMIPLNLMDRSLFNMNFNFCDIIKVMQKNGVCESQLLDDQLLAFSQEKKKSEGELAKESPYFGYRAYLKFLQELFEKYKGGPILAAVQREELLSQIQQSAYFCKVPPDFLAAENDTANGITKALAQGNFALFAQKMTQEFCPASARKQFPFKMNCQNILVDSAAGAKMSLADFRKKVRKNLAQNFLNGPHGTTAKKSLLNLTFCGQFILKGKGYRAKLREHSFDVSKDIERCGSHSALLLGVRVTPRCQLRYILQQSWGNNCQLVSPDWKCDERNGVVEVDEMDLYENMIQFNEIDIKNQ